MRPALVALALLALPGCASAPSAKTVVLDVEHSKFSTSAVTVPRGVAVTFVVRNGDPIDHELIVGDDDLQRRHRTGTEPSHGDRPGEVTVVANETASTTVTFDRPGTVYFACHLPGHYAYGMRGVVTVTG